MDSMLGSTYAFQNPFRFGKALPWQPAGNSKPIWDIDKTTNVLSSFRFAMVLIEYVELYNESIFGNAEIGSDEGRNELRQVWQKILMIMEKSQPQAPFSANLLTAAATRGERPCKRASFIA